MFLLHSSLPPSAGPLSTTHDPDPAGKRILAISNRLVCLKNTAVSPSIKQLMKTTDIPGCLGTLLGCRDEFKVVAYGCG